MLILFPKRKGVKIATTLIFQEIDRGASFHYLLGMVDFAASFGAITAAEKQALLDYIAEKNSAGQKREGLTTPLFLCLLAVRRREGAGATKISGRRIHLKLLFAAYRGAQRAQS